MSGRGPLDPRCRPTLTGAALLLLLTICAPAASSATSDHRAPVRFDPNRATRAELELLPRIGPTLAGYIVAARNQAGGFDRLADLDHVPRIGPVTLAGLQPWLIFPAEAPSDSEPR